MYSHRFWGRLCNRHINKSGQSFQRNPSSYFCEVHFWGIFPYLSPPFLSGWTFQTEQTGEFFGAETFGRGISFALWESHEVRQSKESIDISHFEPEDFFPEHTRRGLVVGENGSLCHAKKNIIGILDQASAPSCHVKQMCKRGEIYKMALKMGNWGCCKPCAWSYNLTSNWLVGPGRGPPCMRFCVRCFFIEHFTYGSCKAYVSETLSLRNSTTIFGTWNVWMTVFFSKNREFPGDTERVNSECGIWYSYVSINCWCFFILGMYTSKNLFHWGILG